MPGGTIIRPVDVQSIERATNAATLDRLRTYSLARALILFAVSLGIGWLVAGWVLRPIGRITASPGRHRARARSGASICRVPTTSCAGWPTPSTDAGPAGRRVRGQRSSPRGLPRAAQPDGGRAGQRRPAAVRARRSGHGARARRPHPRRQRAAGPARRRPAGAGSARRAAPAPRAGRARPAARGLAGELEEPAAEAGVVLAVRGDRAAAAVDRIAVRRAVANLVENALRHAPAGSAVRLPGERAAGRGSRSRTRVPASTRRTARASSIASTASTAPAPGLTAAAASASPSCARWPAPTAARPACTPSRAAARASCCGCRRARARTARPRRRRGGCASSSRPCADRRIRAAPAGSASVPGRVRGPAARSGSPSPSRRPRLPSSGAAATGCVRRPDACREREAGVRASSG